MNNNPTTEVTLRSAPGTLAILEQDPCELRALLAQTLGGGALELQDLDHVKMPAGGALTFTVPTPTGEESRRTLTGVLVHVQQRRAYWPSEFSGSGTAPDCSSSDGIVGVGSPGGACAVCPLSQFPQEGGGPPCRLTAELVAFLEGDVLPTIVTVSPASVRVVARYLLALAKRGLRYSDVVTVLGLERAQSQSGIAFARLTCTMTGPLEPTQRARMREIIAALGFGTPPTLAASSATPVPTPSSDDLDIPEHATLGLIGDAGVPSPATSTDDDIPF
jgi:hypothetical protein